MQREVLIVGAGITGSLTASLLSRSQPHINTTVWDKVTDCALNYSVQSCDKHNLEILFREV